MGSIFLKIKSQADTRDILSQNWYIMQQLGTAYLFFHAYNLSCMRKVPRWL